jgi:hypothetical protein
VNIPPFALANTLIEAATDKQTDLWEIAKLFSFAIGNGIFTLRSEVFKTLETKVPAARSDILWRRIVTILRKSDRTTGPYFNQIPYQHYPRTVKEAKSFFVTE